MNTPLTLHNHIFFRLKDLLTVAYSENVYLESLVVRRPTLSRIDKFLLTVKLFKLSSKIIDKADREKTKAKPTVAKPNVTQLQTTKYFRYDKEARNLGDFVLKDLVN